PSASSQLFFPTLSRRSPECQRRRFTKGNQQMLPSRRYLTLNGTSARASSGGEGVPWHQSRLAGICDPSTVTLPPNLLANGFATSRLLASFRVLQFPALGLTHARHGTSCR